MSRICFSLLNNFSSRFFSVVDWTKFFRRKSLSHRNVFLYLDYQNTVQRDCYQIAMVFKYILAVPVKVRCADWGGMNPHQNPLSLSHQLIDPLRWAVFSSLFCWQFLTLEGKFSPNFLRHGKKIDSPQHFKSAKLGLLSHFLQPSIYFLRIIVTVTGWREKSCLLHGLPCLYYRPVLFFFGHKPRHASIRPAACGKLLADDSNLVLLFIY